MVWVAFAVGTLNSGALTCLMSILNCASGPEWSDSTAWAIMDSQRWCRALNLIVLAGSPCPVPCVRSMGALMPPFTDATPLRGSVTVLD